MNYYSLILLVCIVNRATSISLQISGARTCLSLEAENENEHLLINYHHNANKGTAALRIYNTDGSVLADSGQGRNYQHNLDVTLPTKGLYDICFEKSTPSNLDVSFQVYKQEEQLSYAGKEELGRLTRRIGEFLVEIKKASWEYKQILAQHNQRHNKFHHYETDNYFIYGLKLLVMVLVLSGQIWIVRKIFD